jgi:hypothetical protein
VLTKVKEKEKYYPSIPYPIRIYKKKKKKEKNTAKPNPQENAVPDDFPTISPRSKLLS